MPLLQVLITLIVVGILLWLVNRFIPMAGSIKSILNAVVVIAVVLWLLNIFGLLQYSHQHSHRQDVTASDVVPDELRNPEPGNPCAMTERNPDRRIEAGPAMRNPIATNCRTFAIRMLALLLVMLMSAAVVQRIPC